MKANTITLTLAELEDIIHRAIKIGENYGRELRNAELDVQDDIARLLNERLEPAARQRVAGVPDVFCNLYEDGALGFPYKSVEESVKSRSHKLAVRCIRYIPAEVVAEHKADDE